MLNIHFINVADGDAILLEEVCSDRTTRVLIDTGRPYPKKQATSLATTSLRYLTDLGITEIDILIITHLHIDHFGALNNLLDHITVKELYTGYLPPADAAPITPDPDSAHTVLGMVAAINDWLSYVRRMQSSRIPLHEVYLRQNLTLPGGCVLTLYPPKENYWELQHKVWHNLFRGIPCTADEMYRASKSRNPGSLRVGVAACGKTAMLGGDCYGEEWENEPLKPCDIFKIPHHCDAKSMTPLLAKKMHPVYAVASCGADYMPNKDRPSETAARMLTELGSRLYLTDSFSGSWYTPRFTNALLFRILDDGTILTPDDLQNQ